MRRGISCEGLSSLLKALEPGICGEDLNPNCLGSEARGEETGWRRSPGHTDWSWSCSRGSSEALEGRKASGEEEKEKEGRGLGVCGGRWAVRSRGQEELAC